MDVKFSQLPLSVTINNTDTFPILKDGENKMAPVYSIYNYMSGNTLIRLYTTFATNSSYLLNSSNLANSVYTQYFQNSSFYVLTTDEEYQNWNYNYSTTRSLSSKWDTSSTYTQSISSKIIFSDTNPTLYPNSSAIKNIIAITQTNYDNLTFKDPQTFYVIASV
jgi:hypothetical protein